MGIINKIICFFLPHKINKIVYRKQLFNFFELNKKIRFDSFQEGEIFLKKSLPSPVCIRCNKTLKIKLTLIQE